MEQIKIVKEYYPGTEMILERCETRSGKRHGTFEQFYKSGRIESRAEYVDGKEHGTSEWFYESGKICFRTEYVDGKEHGLHKRYNLKGDLVLDIMFEDGVQINIKDSLNVVNLDKLTGFLDTLPPEEFNSKEPRSACVVEWFPRIFSEVEYSELREGFFKSNGVDMLDYDDVTSFMLNVSYGVVAGLLNPQNGIHNLFPTLPVCGEKATPKEVSARLKAFKKLVMTE